MGFLAVLLIIGVVLLALSVVIAFFAFTGRFDSVGNEVPISELFTDGK